VLILGILLAILYALYMYQQFIHESEDNKPVKATNIKAPITSAPKNNELEAIDDIYSLGSLGDEISNESGLYKKDSMAKSSAESNFLDGDSNADSIFF
jgi:hypothetical protein